MSLAWILTPLVLLAIAVGLGLLLERLLRIELPTAVLVPLGLCSMVVLVMPGYQVGAGAWLSVTVTVVATIAGFVLRRASLRSRLRDDSYAVIAGGVVYVLYLAPVLLAGGWTW